MVGVYRTYGERQEMHIKFWSGNLNEKRPLWRPRSRWLDNIKMGHEDKRIVSVCRMSPSKWGAYGKISVPYTAGNFLTSWATTSFSRRTLVHRVSKTLWWAGCNFNADVRFSVLTLVTISSTVSLDYRTTRRHIPRDTTLLTKSCSVFSSV
jgi:hypothetical protein